jgi:hypothetical protein
MRTQERLSQRMTLLFLGALLLVAGQALRVPPLRPPPFVRVWRGDEQILPIAVPAGEAPVTASLARSPLEELQERAVDWNPGPRQHGLPCEIFLHISRHHWARLALGRERLAELLGAKPPAGTDRVAILSVSASDLLADADGDGDSLDPGELLAPASGVEVRLYCAADGGGRRE